METKSFKINIPEGFEIDKEKSTFEEIIFKPVKKELPKRWEELENISGYYVENCSIPEYFAVLGKVDKVDRNVFPTLEEAEAVIALAQLCQLRDIYNEGWKPDWKNNEYKYCINIIRGKYLTVETCTLYQEVLHFKTKNLAKQFLENFKDLIEQAKPLL